MDAIWSGFVVIGSCEGIKRGSRCEERWRVVFKIFDRGVCDHGGNRLIYNPLGRGLNCATSFYCFAGNGVSLNLSGRP